MYDYETLQKDMERFRRYTKCGEIGRSVLARPIPYLFLGHMGCPQLLVQCAVHAREHITSAFAALLADRYLSSRTPRRYGLWLVPMANPDGVELCAKGLSSVPPKCRQFLADTNGGKDFSLWKANAAGVDLNNNFPARFCSAGSEIEPSSHGFRGNAPLDQPESRALARFTRVVKPAATLSFHCKGEVIYWDFHTCGKERARNLRLARRLSLSTGYPLEDAGNSAGGYKDWCIQDLHIPAFTVEVGSDALSHPLPYEELDGIWQKNKDVVDVLAEGLCTEKRRTT